MTVGKPSLVIIGNSEIAVMAYEYFTHDSSHEVVAFAVDERYITGPSLCGLPVVSIACSTSCTSWVHCTWRISATAG